MATSGAWTSGTGDAGKGYAYGASPPLQHQHLQAPGGNYIYQQQPRPNTASRRGSAICVLAIMVAALGLISLCLEITYLRLSLDRRYIPDLDCYPIATGVWAGGLLLILGSVGAVFARRAGGEGVTKATLGPAAAAGYLGFVAALANAYMNTFTCLYGRLDDENSFAVWVPLVVAGLSLKAGVLATVAASMACCGCCGVGAERRAQTVVMVPGGTQQHTMYGSQAGVVVNTSHSSPNTLYYSGQHQSSTVVSS